MCKTDSSFTLKIFITKMLDFIWSKQYVLTKLDQNTSGTKDIDLKHWHICVCMSSIWQKADIDSRHYYISRQVVARKLSITIMLVFYLWNSAVYESEPNLINFSRVTFSFDFVENENSTQTFDTQYCKRMQ